MRVRVRRKTLRYHLTIVDQIVRNVECRPLVFLVVPLVIWHTRGSMEDWAVEMLFEMLFVKKSIFPWFTNRRALPLFVFRPADRAFRAGPRCACFCSAGHFRAAFGRCAG